MTEELCSDAGVFFQHTRHQVQGGGCEEATLDVDSAAPWQVHTSMQNRVLQKPGERLQGSRQ